MNKGYFLAAKLENGMPGRPVGIGGSPGITVFDRYEDANDVLGQIRVEHPNVVIFEVNISLVGEVISS